MFESTALPVLLRALINLDICAFMELASTEELTVAQLAYPYEVLESSSGRLTASAAATLRGVAGTHDRKVRWLTAVSESVCWSERAATIIGGESQIRMFE